MTETETTTAAAGQVRLVSTDGEGFELSSAVAAQSELVKTMMADEASDEAGDEAQEIPLPNVKGSVLAKVVEFLEHHVGEPMAELEKPLKSNDLHDAVSDWYADFVELDDHELLFELILAANYLDIKPLLDLACAKVASMIKGKTPEEIRATFGVTAEFTPEEEQMIREENKWIEDL